MGRTHSGARRIFSITLLVAAGFAITAFLILLLRLPDQFAGLKSGDLLPRVRLVSPDGQPVDTDSWRGRPTLLVFFDPSCPACQNELDNIDALAPALPGLRIALLSTRPQHSGETRIASYLDRTGVLTRRMRRFAVPAIYWISPDGRIQYARSGARSLTEDASIFNDLLARKGTTTADRKEGSADGTGMLCR
jgi:hypothetical protein